MTAGRHPALPEVLAPAGDRACLEAAVRAGADAVYFGLTSFNARARAENFDTEALADVMDYLHRHGVRGYVTLNTLVFDAELARVEAAARACAAARVDAVIVQDLGVARLVRALTPELALHASTQMTCTDADSVTLAGELGAERVILARELSLDDIAAIRSATDTELEVFVHGALCVSYSGQCLTSEAIGGRSANRGACAQSCRLPYELYVDGERHDVGERAYLLSPQDLEASALVPALAQLGVSSLKIEGRYKGPEYVAATTALYRKAVDALESGGAPPDDEDRALALAVFSRGSGPGFLAGIDHQRLVEGRGCEHRGLLVAQTLGVVRRGKRHELRLRLDAPLQRGDGVLIEGGYGGAGELGGRVWAITTHGEARERAEAGQVATVWLGPEVPLGEDTTAGRRVFRTNDPARERRARALAARGRRRLDLELTGRFGEAPLLRGRCGPRTVAVQVEAPVAAARGQGLDEPTLRDKLGRLGDTAFALGTLTIALPPGAHLPVSALNRARRALVAALADTAATGATPARAAPRPIAKNAAELCANAEVPTRAPPPPGLFVLCRTLGQAEAALDAGAEGVYLDFLELVGTGRAVTTLRARGARWIGLAPPRIRKPGEERIDQFLASLAPDAMLVRGLGALRRPTAAEDAPEGAWMRVADASLNVTNRLSAVEVLSHAIDAFTPSFDLDGPQLTALLRGELGPFAEVVVHHPMALFHMEHCVVAALLSNGADYKTCGRPCEQHSVSLRDRAGMDHPVEVDVGCRNTVFHGHAQSAAELCPRLHDQGVRRFRIELVREDAAQTQRLVTAYRRLLAGAIEPRGLLGELRGQPGYGVVRGSLRVLA